MSNILILLAHGSPEPVHADSVNAIADRVRTSLGSDWIVRTAFLQHHGPTLTQALGSVESSPGSSVPGSSVLVHPLLLTAGNHWRHDVPAALSPAGSSLDIHMLPPLRPVDLTAAVLEALHEVENPVGNQPSLRRIMLVAGGSRANDPVGHFRPLASSVRHALDASGGVHENPNSVARVEVVSSPSQLPDHPGIVPNSRIVPLLVSRGHLYDEVARATTGRGLRVAQPIGQTEAFAAVIASQTKNWVTAVDPR